MLLTMDHLQPLITIITTVSTGIFCIILAERIKLPSIIFLLAAGICLGPFGANLVQPHVFNTELPQYISLLVALILFEGGTSLKFKQFKEISGPLRQLLSLGMIITLILASMGAHWILGLPWLKALLFGSILIVTGPTVVQPILHRIRVKEKVHNILKWESILIDPIGVVIAIVLSEILLIGNIGPMEGLGLLAARIIIGLGLGFIAGQTMRLFLSNPALLRFESEELSGIFILGVNLLFFGLSEYILSESGMVTVTVAGIILGNMKLANIETILRFKKQLTLIALSVIFILLSAQIPLIRIFGIMPEGTYFLLFLIFIVRPVSVLISTFKEKSLSIKEKLFLCFFAPRGIVSAVLASLLTILFEENGLVGRGVFLPLAFYVIVGSIIFYAVTGRLTARLLDLVEEKGKSILIIGANPNLIGLARKLRDCGFPPIFIDTNPDLCQSMSSQGFKTFHGNGTDKNFLESLDLKGVRQMIAATPNHEANILACQLMNGYIGNKLIFRIWGKEDSWSKTNPSHLEIWGRPVLLPQTESRNDHQLPLKKSISESVVITKEYYESLKIKPVFAIYQNEPLFITPSATIPAGSEFHYLSN